MIALDTPTMVLQADIATATGTTEPVVHVVARTVQQETKCGNEEYQSRMTRTVITGSTPITVCAAPAVNQFKAISYVGHVNRSTDTEIARFYTYDGTNRYPLIIRELEANEGLFYEENRGWYVLDQGGGGEVVIQIQPNYTAGGTFDGGGSAPIVDSVFYYIASFSGTILGWSIVADQVGSCVIDVWKASSAVPDVTDTIAGSEKPTLSSEQIKFDTNLTTWTDTDVSVGDVFGFNLDSVTDCTRISVFIKVGTVV